LIADPAHHARLEVIEGDLVRQVACVEDGVVMTARVAAIDEQLRVSERPLLDERQRLVVQQQVGDRPRHTANIGAPANVCKPLGLELCTDPRATFSGHWNLLAGRRLVCEMEENAMARQQTSRGRKQDRARVAGGQDYEVGYEAGKMRKSGSSVRKTVKKVGNSRKRVEHRLGR
jgi:Protein of unknown function (DUF3606)